MSDDSRNSHLPSVEAGSREALLLTAARLTSAADELQTSVSDMNTRTFNATSSCSDAICEALMSVLGIARSLKQSLSAAAWSLQLSLDKAFDDAESMAKLLEAGNALSVDPRSRPRLALASLLALSSLAHRMPDPTSRMCIPLAAARLAALPVISTVWRELPDGSLSELHGIENRTFTGGLSRNHLSVLPRLRGGAVADYVNAADVQLVLHDVAGSHIETHTSVERTPNGVLKVAFAIGPSCPRVILLQLFVCGVRIGECVQLFSGYSALSGDKHVASVDVYLVRTYVEGIAVNADNTLMAITYSGDYCCICLYSVEPLTRVSNIGEDGVGPAGFGYPRGVCFTTANTLLVCDFGSNRVQQLSEVGEMLSSFNVQTPISIALHGDTVAVGTGTGRIEMHSLATGELLRIIGSQGADPGQLHEYASGLCFSRDGAQLIVAETRSRRLSLFSSDGDFISVVGDGLLATESFNTVCLGALDEIIVADQSNHRICVFSPDGSTLLKTWGVYGTDAAPGSMNFPNGIAVSGRYLYVMDLGRVQMFE